MHTQLSAGGVTSRESWLQQAELAKEPPFLGAPSLSLGVSRILFRSRRTDDDHLSGPGIADRARAAYLGLVSGQLAPCLALLLVGFT